MNFANVPVVSNMKGINKEKYFAIPLRLETLSMRMSSNFPFLPLPIFWVYNVMSNRDLKLNMELSSIDLREQTCPIALLLAKRACDKLYSGDKLLMLLSDTGSSQDIFRYLARNEFKVEMEIQEKTIVFHIEKIKR